MKFYHASVKAHKVGDVIHPRPDGKVYGGGRGIYCTTSPEPHYTLLDTNPENGFSKNQKGDLYLYQVLPIGNNWHKGMWDDIVCPLGVEIIKSLGQVPKSGKVSGNFKGGKTLVKQTFPEKSKKPRYVVIDKRYRNSFYNSEYKKALIRGFKNLDNAKKFIEKSENKQHYILYDRFTKKEIKIE